MLFVHWLLIFTYLGLVRARGNSVTPFSPSKYPKKTAHCDATRRAPVEEVVAIQLKYVDINPDSSTTLIMVHGWPSLWSTWSNQIQEFQEDYHLIVPDLRGFGESTHPGDSKSSGTMGDMVGDLVCILEHANVSSAICIGHDWGSSICYEAARSRPDIFAGVVGGVVPYIPSSGPFIPVKHLLSRFPAFAYQLFFDSQPDTAVAELDKDIRRTVRAVLRTIKSHPPAAFLKDKDSFLAAWNEVEEIPPVTFFTPEEEDYFVEQYSIQGFKHTLQFYTTENRYQAWKHAHSQGNYTISQPALAIYPKEDPVADWLVVATVLKSADYLPNLTTEVLPGAHWVQLEYPKEFNAVVREWLQKTYKQGDNNNGGSRDEL